MNWMRDRATRRLLLAGTSSSLALALLGRHESALGTQSDRDYLDLLVLLEETEIAYVTAILQTFDEAAFAAQGLPDDTRSDLEVIRSADEIHLALLVRPEATPVPTPAPPTSPDLHASLRMLGDLKDLAVATYGLVIPELGRQRLIPDLMGVHSVEARHAEWLAALLGERPFPELVDPGMALDEVTRRLVGFASGLVSPATPFAAATAPLEAIARDLGIPATSLTVISSNPQVWPNASLGCPRPGEVYAEVLTPGFLIEVDHAGERLTYHADERGTVVRCP